MDIKIEKLRECADDIWEMIPTKARKYMNPITGEFIYAVMESIQNLCKGETNNEKSGLNLDGVIVPVCAHDFSPSKRWVHCCSKCGELHVEKVDS